jgi:integrase
MIRLLLETGITTDEVINIRPKDIEFTSNSLIVGQERKRRAVKVSLELSLLLNSFADPSCPYLFYSACKQKLTARRVQQIVLRYRGISNLSNPASIRKASLLSSYKKSGSVTQTKYMFGIKNLKQKDYLDHEQISRLLLAVRESQHLIMLKILIEAGCQLNELANLKIERINTASQTIIFGRGISERKVKISQTLSNDLEEFIRTKLSKAGSMGSGYLFSTRQSPAITDKRIFQIIKRYAKEAGITKVNPRILRNTAIERAIRSQLPADQIASRFGIKSLEIHQFGMLKRLENDHKRRNKG